ITPTNSALHTSAMLPPLAIIQQRQGAGNCTDEEACQGSYRGFLYAGSHARQEHSVHPDRPAGLSERQSYFLGGSSAGSTDIIPALRRASSRTSLVCDERG